MADIKNTTQFFIVGQCEGHFFESKNNINIRQSMNAIRLQAHIRYAEVF